MNVKEETAARLTNAFIKEENQLAAKPSRKRLIEDEDEDLNQAVALPDPPIKDEFAVSKGFVGMDVDFVEDDEVVFLGSRNINDWARQNTLQIEEEEEFSDHEEVKEDKNIGIKRKKRPRSKTKTIVKYTRTVYSDDEL